VKRLGVRKAEQPDRPSLRVFLAFDARVVRRGDAAHIVAVDLRER